MTTLIQARAALAVAQKANTRAQWQAAALALAAVVNAAPTMMVNPAPAPVVNFPAPVKPGRARRAVEGLPKRARVPFKSVSGYWQDFGRRMRALSQYRNGGLPCWPSADSQYREWLAASRNWDSKQVADRIEWQRDQMRPA